MRKQIIIPALLLVFASCTKEINNSEKSLVPAIQKQESLQFSKLSSITLQGETGAAEISAFDPATKKLFVVNNGNTGNKIDVFDLTIAANPDYLTSIAVSPYGGLVNSVDVSNGKLAAAIESTTKTTNGKLVVFNTADYSELAVVSVGALPDMTTFTPDGKFILTANEGEPNDAYTVDPVGTVSIIDVANSYQVNTLDFSAFATRQAELMAKGLRIFGKNASFAQDIEPEYIAVSSNSNTAWVTLQENNAVAKIDLQTQAITDIFGLGFKDYSLPQNSFDPSDANGLATFGNWPVKAMYLPDGMAVIPSNGTPFIYTANEGDQREYSGFNETKRVKNITLDATTFPNNAIVKQDANLGRLNITSTLGNTSGVYNELYSFGARSFTVWNGNTGEQVFDSGDQLDRMTNENGSYPDNRSDDKGTEPEGITFGRVGNNNLLFVGLERGNAVLVYDVTNPVQPKFLQFLPSGGVAPEGLLFIEAAKSPNGKSILVVSNETSGQVTIFTTE